MKSHRIAKYPHSSGQGLNLFAPAEPLWGQSVFECFLPAEVKQRPSWGGDAVSWPAQQVELRQGSGLLCLDVLQVEATHQEVFAPNVLRHQVHLRNTWRRWGWWKSKEALHKNYFLGLDEYKIIKQCPWLSVRKISMWTKVILCIQYLKKKVPL